MLDIKNVTQPERILPNSAFNSYLFEGENFGQVLNDFLLKYSSLPITKETFYTSDKHTIDEMGSPNFALSFVCFLIRLLRPTQVFEIGSFVGFSTVNMASCIDKGSKVTAFEIYQEFGDIARRNIEKFKLIDRAEIIIGDAKSELKSFEKFNVDLAFIDGNKEDYPYYLNWFLNHLSPCGLIIIDDIFFHGDQMNKQPKTAKGHGVRDTIKLVSERTDVVFTLLPISNGMLLVSKK